MLARLCRWLHQGYENQGACTPLVQFVLLRRLVLDYSDTAWTLETAQV
jgi:hypothetical protein